MCVCEAIFSSGIQYYHLQGKILANLFFVLLAGSLALSDEARGSLLRLCSDTAYDIM